MILYAYYDGHANRWVVTRTDPGPGRILLIDFDPEAAPELTFFEGETPVEISE